MYCERDVIATFSMIDRQSCSIRQGKFLIDPSQSYLFHVWIYSCEYDGESRGEDEEGDVGDPEGLDAGGAAKGRIALSFGRGARVDRARHVVSRDN